MNLYFLGTGSAFPTSLRFVSSLALKLEEGDVWLFDCGEGAQIQIQKVNVSCCKVKKIFITHLHGDHVFGLPGLLCTISSKVADKMATLHSEKLPLIEIYGPVGLRRLINTSLSLSHTLLSFNYKIHELEPAACQYKDSAALFPTIGDPPIFQHPSELPGSLIKPSISSKGDLTWPLFEDVFYIAEAGWIDHCAPCFGFVIKEKERVGTLLVDKLKSLGIAPGPLYGRLKSGETVTAECGLRVLPKDVLSPPIPGRTLVILGDTCDATSMAHLVKECDVLVHEATHDDSLCEKALQYGHSTPKGAAAMATKVGAKTLIMNHFSQRYKDQDEESTQEENTTALLKKQAASALEGTNTIVVCAYDTFCYEVKRPSRSF